MKYKIRRYTPADIPRLVELVQQFLLHQVDGKRNYFADIDFDPSKVYSFLKMKSSQTTFFCNVVEDENGNIVGGLAGYLAEFAFSYQLVAKDLILFLNPEKTSLKLVLRLVTSFVTWAEKQGAKEVQLCNSTGFKQEAFGKLAKLVNMQQFEVGYSRRF